MDTKNPDPLDGIESQTVPLAGGTWQYTLTKMDGQLIACIARRADLPAMPRDGVAPMINLNHLTAHLRQIMDNDTLSAADVYDAIYHEILTPLEALRTSDAPVLPS